MKDKKVLKRLLAGVLAAAVTVSAVVLPTTAADENLADLSSKGISVVSPNRDKLTEEDLGYADEDEVRVSIVLEDASTIKAGFDIETIAVDSKAVAYRDSLKVKQQAVAEKIEKATKEHLDVVHNLTLAANIISANVKFGQIKDIEKVSGVKTVVVENKYDAAKTVEEIPTDPNMSTSTYQIGSGVAWAEGYTGAGSKIAVIDTGIDTEHKSFAENAFLYSLKQNAKELNKAFDAYKASLNLLDAAKIEAVMDQLNVKIDPAQVFVSEKIPFAYNYVDSDYDVTHANDTQGEHGSHVEGIAAANKYVEDQYGEFTTAIDSVKVQGVAPDAQIITMKVFGKGGGAYDSDYMLAIEDAVVLGADSVNLSLGSGNGGTSKNANAVYQQILEDLSACGTVVSMSAGNSGHWADSAMTGGYLYADDVNTQTDGSPGSFTNAFTVASADNIGMCGEYFTVGGTPVIYTQTNYTNKPLSTLAGEQEYVFITGNGTEEDWAAIGDALKGKIAVCSRGAISFYQKGEFAVEAGAIATIVYNNTAGSINMDLTDYTKDAPFISITQAEGALFKDNGTLSEDGTYYTGKINIEKGLTSVIVNTGYSEMSSFSSWGVPGSLEMKPEITAPGGNIYSVNGMEHDAYENMSGTSMASPQVAGMAALAAQYIRENGLAEKTGLKARTLAQSLLMSTAEPMIDADNECYYSVLQQGAGLANIGNVVKAESYILMDENANAGAKDGKVKVELGDDPAKKGVYSFGFTLYNLTDSAKKYALSADFFTQGLFYMRGLSLIGANSVMMDTATMLLDTEVKFDCGDTATVPANGKVHVTVTVTISDDDKEFMDAYAPNGFYVEGFVYADGEADEEGNITTAHSIPVLGYYGNWSTVSMFDKGSYEAYYITGTETRAPYLYAATGMDSLKANTFGVTYGGVDGPYFFGGNPYVDDIYGSDRNAVNNTDGTLLSMVQFAAIRNAADSRFIVYNETTKETVIDNTYGAVTGAYYYTNGGRWYKYAQTLKPNYDFSGAKENEKLSITFALAPEYYQDAEGNVRWKDVDLTNALKTTVTIDNTKPVIVSDPVVKDGVLTVTVKDNQHVAAVLLTNKNGSKTYAYAGPDSNEKAGEEYKVEIDVSDINADKLYLQVCDYACNTVTVEINEKFGEGTILPGRIAFNTDYGYYFWTSFDGVDVDEETVGTKYEDSDYLINAATIVDHIVFAMIENGTLIVMPEDDLTDTKEVINFSDYFEDQIVPLDMAYNAKDDKVYVLIGVADGYDISEEKYLIAFDKLECIPEFVGLVPFSALTLACDEDGNFYSGECGTGNVYKYTLDAVTGEEEPELVIDLAEELGEFACGDDSLQAMEWDPNTGKLCWAVYTVEAESYYIEIDTVEKTIEMNEEDLWYQLCALIIPDKSTPSTTPDWAKPTEPTGIIVNAEITTMIKGSSQKLTTTLLPWTAVDAEIEWVSSDEDVLTVSGNGVVKAVSDGTATVYACLKSNKDIFDSVEITVETLNILLGGTLQDAEGNPLMYTWNMSKDTTWKSTNALKSSMVSATVNTHNGHLYVMDGTSNSWSMHEIDPADGSEIAVAPNTMGVPLWDMAYSELFSTEDEPAVFGVYGGYLIGPTDPMALVPNAFDFSMYLWFLTGADYFVAVANMGETEVIDDETEELVAAERIVALDNLGYIWTFDVYALTGENEGYYSCYLNYSEKTCLSEEYPLALDNALTASMVMGEDGYLYLSACDGNTNNLYQLDVEFSEKYDEIYDETYEVIDYTARKIGDAGNDVWPMLITSVKSSLITEIDEETGVEITYTYIEEGVELVVVESEATDTSVTYEISLVDKEGNPVTLDDLATVKIPVPEGFDAEETSVYILNEDGTYTKVDAELVDGYLVFKTDVLGEYILSTEKLDEEVTTAPETEPETTAPETSPELTTGEATNNPDEDENKPTGIAIALVPALVSAAAVMIAKKRK